MFAAYSRIVPAFFVLLQRPPGAVRLGALLALLATLASVAPAAPPERFVVEDVLTEIEQPMSLRFLPDGRLFVLQKKGLIQIVDTSTTPATSAVYLNLASAAHPHGIKADQERGLIDIALDPDFPAQPYIYLFYTPNTGPNGQRARIARFTHRPNSGGLTSRADPASEVILWEDTHGYDSCCHFGGGLDFGPDGKLWLTVGDHFQGSYAASLAHAGGGVIRINKDGTVPADNPYVDGTGPNHDPLFAHGFRNPFRARWDLPSGRLFIGEVGGNEQTKAWEDLHLIEYDAATGRFIDDDFGTTNDNNKFDGINFGWPTVEGLPPYTDFPGATIDRVGEPIFAYPHAGNTAAINGGIVYRGTLFPAHYQGAYFYADSTRDFIRYLRFNPDGSVAPNPTPGPITIKNPDSISYEFDAAPLGRVVALEAGPDGALYFVSFTDQGGAYGVPNPSVLGAVRRYVYEAGNARPEITRFDAEPAEGDGPLNVVFSIDATDPEGGGMAYVVHFGDGTSSAPQALGNGVPAGVSYTYNVDGVYEARVEVSDGVTTAQQTFVVRVGTPPVVTSITGQNSRAGGSATTFRYGDTFTFTAAATDFEDGTLPASAFTWTVSFVRPGNVHPAFGPETGSRSITFPIPAQGQGFSGPVFYRASLTVTDASGLTTQAQYDIHPEKANISLRTEPAGIMVQVDGNTERAAPYILDTLINFNHTISVPERVCVDGTDHRFTGWSNGPTTPQQMYVVPPQDTTLTAVYTPVGPCVGPPSDGLVFHLKADAGVIANGSAVLAWEDQSASSNHLSAVGAPAFVASNGPNGQRYIHFDGVDDALRRTTLSGLPTGAADRSVFMVVRYNAANSSTGGWAGYTYGTRTNNGAFGLSLTPEGYLGVQGWGTGNDIEASPAVTSTGRWLTHGAVYREGVLTQFVDGNLAGSTTRPYATGNGSIWLGEELGGGKNLNMDVAEVLVYSRALTAEEQGRIATYFDDKYVSGTTTNTAPSVTIVEPEHLAEISRTTMPITLTGIASDTQDGNISNLIQWSSSLDGSLGSGSERTVTLTAGTHTLRAHVTDSGGLEAADEITITVVAPDDPTDPAGLVTEGLVLHLEADLNVSTGSGSTVAGWLDQSGLGNDLVAGGAPQLLPSATPTGRPAIRFDGNDDKLERVQATDALGGLPAGNANRTMYLVTRYNNTKAWGGAAYGNGANNQTFGLSVKHPTGQLVLHGWGSGNDLVSGTAGVGAGWLIQSALLQNGSASMHKNGQQIAQFTHTYATQLNRLVIGQEISGAGYVGMDVAAVLIYDRALSAAERAAVEAYLTDKYVSSVRPTVTITAPADGAGYAAGSTVTFSGTATDPTLGDISSRLRWSSNLSGALGQGATLSTNSLSSGTHTITATVTNDANESASQQITVSIAASNTAPVVSITAPANGSTHAQGSTITFSATASDTQDGNVSGTLVWTSSRDGQIGTGPSFTRSNLSVGTHTITAAASDAAGANGTAQVSLTITEASTPTVPVTTGLVLRLEATDGVTTSSGAVNAWLDQSTRGNHVTGSGGPLLVAGATPSGRPAIRLDGVDDRLDRVHATNQLAGFPVNNNNRTLFVVARYLSTTWWGGVSYGQAANGRAFGLGVKHPSGELFLQGYGGSYDLVSTATGTGAGWLIQTGLLENGTARLFKNGTQVAQKSQTFGTTLGRFVIGEELGDLGHQGMEVAAVLLYDRALTTEERAQVTTYLQNRYLAAAPANTAPDVTITAPANNSSHSAGSSVTFTATATDPEEGNIASRVTWSSSRDGALGTGASLSVSTLSVGTHTITAAVTDNGNLSDQAQITVTITQTPANTAPTVTITAPANNSSHTAGSSVTFTATATDTEDGNIASRATWSSSRDGALGTGASLSLSTLSVGVHTITASVTDNGGLASQAQITVTITQTTNAAPTVTITAPANNSSHTAGSSVTFTATATDAEEGNIASRVAWSSSVDGAFGTGASVSVSTLSVGTHVVTARVTDTPGLSSQSQVTVTIGSAPVALPVTTGLVLRLEATTGVTTTGGAVTSWSDQSGRNNHVTSRGGPTLSSALTPTGKPAIVLDGVDDQLERVHATQPLTAFPIGNGNRTLFVVARYRSTTWWSGVAYGTAAQNQAFGVGVKHPSGELFLQGFGKGNDLVSSTAGVGAGWLVQSATLNNGAATLRKDGQSIAQFTHSFATTLTRFSIGQELAGAGYAGMDVAAVLLYDRALTTEEHSSVLNYLRTLYLQ